jgi:outer membrane protein assembly factor BamA
VLIAAGAVAGQVPVPVRGLPPGFRWRPTGSTVAGEDVAELARALNDAGWLEARVRAETAATGAVTLIAEPGVRSVVERWQLAGNRVLPDDRLLHELPRGSPLTGAVLAIAAARLLALYDAGGRPLAAVSLRAAEPVAPGRYVVTLGVDEGEQVAIGFLEFVGAEPVSSRVLVHRARFTPGAWNSRRVSSWLRNLDASGLVRVESRELVAADGGHGLQIRVRPERANRAGGAVGYDAARGELSGSIRLRLENIANSGRRLRATWESLRGRIRYELGYTELALLGSRLDVIADVHHQAFDTTAARTGFELSVLVPIAAEVDVSLGTGYERIAGLDPAGRAQTAWAATGISGDTRSPRVNPESGLSAGLTTSAGRRQGAEAGHLIGRAEADAVVVGPRLGRLVLENQLHGRAVVTAAALSDIELYRLGGAASLRGHREDAFTARRLGWWNCELRLRVERATAVYTFLDVGAVGAADGLEVPLGYGIGARVGTAIGGFEAAYALSPGDGPLAGSVHFRFEGEF